MKNNSGFTLIELLAVIVVLAIVSVLATRSVLPYMSNAREDAFRIEATNIVKSASDATNFYNLGQINLKNDTSSCKKDKVLCFTVEELINLGLYDGSKDVFSGKVLIDTTNQNQPLYTLYLAKGAEFNIDGSTITDYVNNGKNAVNQGAWATENNQNTCSCS